MMQWCLRLRVCMLCAWAGFLLCVLVVRSGGLAVCKLAAALCMGFSVLYACIRLTMRHKSALHGFIFLMVAQLLGKTTFSRSNQARCGCLALSAPRHVFPWLGMLGSSIIARLPAFSALYTVATWFPVG
jgi:hypothetical protein